MPARTARPARPRPRSAGAPPDRAVARWIERHLTAARLRAPSLVITVWGDAIMPHGGAVLLPGLIELLAPFGLNERLVRTSVFRLVRQGWLEATPVGRRSLYALTADGARRAAEAHQRIYGPAADHWDATWEIVLANGLALAERRALADELRWAGYGIFGHGVFARPTPAASPVPAMLRALGLADRAVVVRATDVAVNGARTLASTVDGAWDLSEVAALYRAVLRAFGTVVERFRLQTPDGANPEQCLVVRTLLIHAYRRVLLRDPQLPPALLPLDWPGAAAYALARDVYRLTQRGAERHLVATLEGPQGPLPPAAPSFHRRFGGLSGPR